MGGGDNVVSCLLVLSLCLLDRSHHDRTLDGRALRHERRREERPAPRARGGRRPQRGRRGRDGVELLAQARERAADLHGHHHADEPEREREPPDDVGDLGGGGGVDDWPVGRGLCCPGGGAAASQSGTQRHTSGTAAHRDSGRRLASNITIERTWSRGILMKKTLMPATHVAMKARSSKK